MVDSPFDVEIEVGEVIDAEPFPEAEKPEMTKLWIDLSGDAGDESEAEGGGEPIQSAAQLDYHYDADALVGRQVLCATNLGSVRIAGFKSEALTVGVPCEEGYPILVSPDEEVPLGGPLY
ncbi:tRNA-binding protein [Natrinema salifodinae]|uniref:tRNA-binding protein n=1 Tax=Natrinema salifodinae TaxID=1202768 RepID=A0A1I0PFR6_9EURY|nr:tRNA-binding protein [Natrinema salifodinae]SEW13045.1 tRNA-binding protein [Natrinema salifodinae]